MILSRSRLFGSSALFAAVCLFSAPLAAQSHAAENDVMAPPAPPAQAQPHGTLLSFSTQGVVKAMPNQLAIHFSARVQNTSPATAQQRLNQLVKNAMETVSGQQDISLHAGNYNLSQEYNQHGPQRWDAEQSLTLRGQDTTRLLALAEKLQAQGLGLTDMDWSIDPQTRQKLEDQARLEALKQVRSQAESDAQALGLKVIGLERVQVGASPLPEEPIARPMMLMSARSSAPAPESTPEEQSVRVNVSVQARLAPAAPPPAD